jgi:molecular chaperone IbpA
LADYVEVTDAKLENGLLTIKLVREVPEAMKPKTITIQTGDNALEHELHSVKDDSKEKSKAA